MHLAASAARGVKQSSIRHRRQHAFERRRVGPVQHRHRPINEEVRRHFFGPVLVGNHRVQAASAAWLAIVAWHAAVSLRKRRYGDAASSWCERVSARSETQPELPVSCQSVSMRVEHARWITGLYEGCCTGSAGARDGPPRRDAVPCLGNVWYLGGRSR